MQVPGQVLNEITNTYANLAVDWLNTLVPMARNVFAVLATIELSWSGIWWALSARSSEGALPSIVHKVFVLMFFFTIVLFADAWIPFLISGFIEAGIAASGWNSLNPSNVLQQGLDLGILLWDNATDAFSWFNPTPIWAFLVPPTIVVIFAVIAGFLTATLVESFFVIGGGVLMLGFAGSRWTASFAEGYLLYAVRVGIRLFVLFLLVGAGMSLVATWLPLFEELPAGSPRLFFEILAASIVLLLVVWRVPLLASQMLHYRASFGMERAYQDPV